MKLVLTRTDFSPESTIGTLSTDGKFECFTLEDTVRDGPKVFGKTAIPKGNYEVRITFSNHFKRDLPLLMNVPNFEGVRIHSGNVAADTEGCVLVGRTKDIDRINNSRDAFDSLYAKLLAAWFRKEPITITVE